MAKHTMVTLTLLTTDMDAAAKFAEQCSRIMVGLAGDGLDTRLNVGELEIEDDEEVIG